MISTLKVQDARYKVQVEQRLACLLLLTACCFISACTTDLEKVHDISAANNSISERGEDIEIRYSEMGILRAKITAKELITYQADEPYMEFSKGVNLDFFNSSLMITSKLTASYGIYYTKKEEMLVRDNVVIVNVKGDTLNTEELTWKRKEEKLYSDKFVRIITPEEILYGTGFEAKQDFSDYIIKNISGIVAVDSEKKKR